MDGLMQQYNLFVKKVRGKDENDMYKNYINDIPEERILLCACKIFYKMKVKDNNKASELRRQGNKKYYMKEYDESIKLYSKSLRYATYNSEDYALVLGHRSTVFFIMKEFKTCIKDIDLCLKSNYPENLKPKVLIRKAFCLQNLGQAREMKTLILDVLNIINRSESLKEQYGCKAVGLLLDTVDQPPEIKDTLNTLPVLEANPIFLNASASVTLTYTKRKGRHVVAQRDIARGEVLFVEKAFASAPFSVDCKMVTKIFCQYCWLKLGSCVPCKNCVKFLYCNEECRDSAWTKFHQWECRGVQSNYFNLCTIGYLALRIIFKAIHEGLPTHILNFKEGIASYGSNESNYPYVYNFAANLRKVKQTHLMLYCASAALTVNYLESRTNFFTCMKEIPAYACKSRNELMNVVGGLIIRHCAQLQCNIIANSHLDCTPIGREVIVAETVCPSLSLMRHACLPNTTRYFVGDVAVVKALKNIKKNDEIFYTFNGVPLYLFNYDYRKQLLLDFCFTKCECRLCTDPRLRKNVINSLFCRKCKGPAIPIDNERSCSEKICVCLDCNSKFAVPKKVTAKEELINKSFLKFKRLGNIDEANRCLALSKSIYRPSHSVFEAVYLELRECYRCRNQLKPFFETTKLLIDNCQQKCRENDLENGLIRFKCTRMTIDMLKNNALDIDLDYFGEVLANLTTYMEEAKDIFSIYCPPFIAELCKLEKAMLELRVIHTSRIATRELLKRVQVNMNS